MFYGKKVKAKVNKFFKKSYIPLVEKLYGRKWLLEPNPLKLPEGCDGNIFVGETGDIIITIVSKRKSILDKRGIEKDLKIYLEFKDASKIRKGYSLGTHYQGSRIISSTSAQLHLLLRVLELLLQTPWQN